MFKIFSHKKIDLNDEMQKIKKLNQIPPDKIGKLTANWNEKLKDWGLLDDEHILTEMDVESCVETILISDSFHKDRKSILKYFDSYLRIIRIWGKEDTGSDLHISEKQIKILITDMVLILTDHI